MLWLRSASICALASLAGGELINTADCITHYEHEDMEIKCEGGQCIAEDLKCTSTPYLKIGDATQYRLRSARRYSTGRPEKYLNLGEKVQEYSPGKEEEQCAKLSDLDGEAQRFTLVVPGHSDVENTKMLADPLFLFAPVKSAGTFLRYDFHAVNPKYNPGCIVSEDVNSDRWRGEPPAWSAPIVLPGFYIVRLPVGSWPPDGNEPVMLFPNDKPIWEEPLDRYIYAQKEEARTAEPHWNFSCRSRKDNDGPEEGAYWFFDPPLPEEVLQRLHRYGDRGGRVISATSRSPGISMLAQVVCAVTCFVLARIAA